jgi:hypothetical protein
MEEYAKEKIEPSIENVDDQQKEIIHRAVS